MGNKQLSAFLLFLTLHFFAQIGQAQTDSFSLPAPWRLFRLDNGLEIAVLQDKSLPLALTQVSIAAGSQWEPKRMSGWSCLLSSLLTASNRLYPAPDSFRKTLYREGILYDHLVSPEVLTFRLQGLANKQEFMLNSLQSALQYPILSAGEVSDAKDRLLQQAEEDMSEPLYFLRSELQSRVWGKEAHRKMATGIPSGIVRADSAGLAFFRKHFFVPYRTLLVIISPEDPDISYAQTLRIFGRWSDAASEPEVAFPYTSTPTPDSVELFTVMQEYATLPIFMAAWEIPNARIEDAKILVEILNASDGSFRRNMRDTLKVRELQFQVSGNALFLTLLPDPRNYLRHGPDSVMLQLHRLTQPGFFSREEVQRAFRNEVNRQVKATEKITDRATLTGSHWALGSVPKAQTQADPYFVEQLATEIFLRKSVKAGFICSSNLASITGLNDYFHSLPILDSLEYSLEGDTIFADTALSKVIQGLAYQLNWNPAHKVRLKVFIPSYQVPDAVWEVRKLVVEAFIRSRIAAESSLPAIRRGDFSFEFVKDPEAVLPGVSLPLKEGEVAKDAYQYYMIPKLVRYDAR